MKCAEKYQITLFLFQFKEFAQNVFSFYSRQESLDTITHLGITIPQAKKEILVTVLVVLSLSTMAWAVDCPIPDTGQTGDYTATFGEDSEYTTSPQSYTKLDATGNGLPDTATSWVMVRDNVTGLTWEVKTNDGSIQDKDNTYYITQLSQFIY